MSSTNFTIALIGNPNCGKSSLFNALTGSKQRVANYPGVTVDKKIGYFTTKKHYNYNIVDLPGTYSIVPRSIDEQITNDILMQDNINLVFCVMDASNLQNGLRLLFELKELNKPIVIIMNMIDIADRRGYKYDYKLLSQLLGISIITTNANKKYGINDIIDYLDNNNEFIENSKKLDNRIINIIDKRNNHIQVAKILNKIELNKGVPSIVTEKLDKVLLHPFFGIIILLVILLLLFQAVFSWAIIPKEILQNCFDYFQQKINSEFPNSIFISLIANGIIAGCGAVITFIPQIAIITLFLILLEDSGYLSRAAFLLDRIMSFAGLNGKSFIPILSSYACAIPAIIATRTIESKVNRLITILVSPLTTCSARIPIYTLLISAFIPKKTLLGVFNLQGLVMFFLFGTSIFFVLIMAFIFKFILFKARIEPSIMELPSYKLPSFRNVIYELYTPIYSFIKKAGTIILAIMIILWFLSNFPKAPINATMPAINYSFVGIIAHKILWIFTPIGFNWQIVAALIPGIAAREVVVAALGTIYAISSNGVSGDLASYLADSWSLATGLSLITWYAFAPQCASTLAVVKRETNSNKWPLILFSYQLFLAYIMAFIVYHIMK